MQVFLVLVGGGMIRPVVRRKKKFIKVILEDKVVIKILQLRDITNKLNYMG